MNKGAILLFLIINVSFASFLPDNKVLVLVEESEYNKVERILREKNIRIYHAFPNFGFISSEFNEEFLTVKAIKPKIYKKSVNLERIKEEFSYHHYLLAYIWNSFFEPDKPPDLDKPLPPLINDIARFPTHPLKKRKERAPYGAGFYDISEYMIGKIGVGIILPESNGQIDNNLEDWREYQIRKVLSEITRACDFYQQINPQAYLEFVYEYHVVETSYEPIKRKAPSEENLWISEVLKRMGYRQEYHLEQAYFYANYLRDKYKTDWAIVIFVVNSEKDEDGCFEEDPEYGTLFAYAHPGGPFMVMTYDNNGYTIEWMDAVGAHEIAHLFHACDEYSQSNCLGHYSGYLNVYNGNHELEVLTPQLCIMLGGTRSLLAFMNKILCGYTKGQIGWQDNNKNGMEDILETLTIYPPKFIFFYDKFDILGSLTLLPPYPNKNTYIHGKPAQKVINDITVGRIQLVKIKLEQNNNSYFYFATSTDGSFDEVEEEFILSVGFSSLSSGIGTANISAVIYPGAQIYPKELGVSFIIPGISLEKLSSLEIVHPGSTISYTILYKNWSELTQDCTIEDKIPKYSEFTGTWEHEGEGEVSLIHQENQEEKILKFEIKYIPPGGAGRITYQLKVK